MEWLKSSIKELSCSLYPRCIPEAQDTLNISWDDQNSKEEKDGGGEEAGQVIRGDKCENLR